MHALLIGFESNDRPQIEASLVELSKCAEFTFMMTPAAFDRKFSHYVFSFHTPCYEVLSRIFEENRFCLVFQQINPAKFDFVRISQDSETTDSTIQEATLCLTKLKELSIKVRHDVRSPIQSIYESAELLVQQKALDDREAMLRSVGILHSCATRIYASLDGFNEFHKEIENLEQIFMQKTETNGKR